MMCLGPLLAAGSLIFESRRRRSKPGKQKNPSTDASSTTREMLLWIVRGMVFMMVLTTIAAFALQQDRLLWLAGVELLLSIGVTIIYYLVPGND